MLTSRTAALVVACLTPLLLAASLVGLASGPAQARDKDCGDFANQAAAQQYFLDHGGPQQDPDRLDADGDGIACESDPCPCSSAQGGGGGGDPTTPADPQTSDHARVVRVIDGDTVDVRLHRKVVRVRLLGVDTPEVYGGVECGGPAASRAAKRLLPKGTPVTLVSDPTQDRVDRYGRLLRYLAKAGHIDVSRTQIRTGRGVVYVYEHHPFRRTASYRSAQRYARAHHLGIWRSCR